MRRSLLNKQILSKPLRQALVLITLLLLPNAAWGEEEIKTTFTGYNNSSITFNDNSYMWEIVENQNATFETYEYNNDNSLKISPSTDGAQITVMLKSKFTVSGTLSTNDLLSTLAMGSVETVGTSNGNFKFLYGTSTSPTELLSTQSVTWPIENIELSANNFSNDNDIELSKSHIYIEISGFTKAIYLKSITLSNKLTESFDIKVAGIVPEEDGDITGASPTGTVTYDATTRTLTLNNASIDGDIIKSSSADDKTLIIKLEESNSLTGSIFFDENNHGDLTFTGTGSLNIVGEGHIFENVNSVNTSERLYIATDSPIPHCSNGYYVSILGEDITKVTISNTEAYPIWVYNTSTKEYTQLTATASTYTTPTANVDENHKGSVLYSANNNTLTLDNFLCKTTDQDVFVFHIGSSLTNLTVDLVGTNEIFYNCFNYFKPTDGENLQLTYTTSSSNGSLEFTGGPTYNYVDCAYDDGLGFYSTTISTDWPRLSVGGTLVRGTVSSVGDYDNISYDDETKTLTLSGTTIGSQSSTATAILVYIKDLKVAISGSNTLYGRFDGEYSSAGTISFQNTDHINASLTITAKNLGPVEHFAQCTLGDGLKITEAKNYIDENNTVDVDVDGISYVDGNFKNGEDVPDYLKIAYQAPQLTVAGIEPGADGKFEGLTGVTYTPPTLSLDSQTPDTPATLTLDNATIAGDIRSTLTSLTIHLIGENTLTPGDGVAPFLFTEGSGSGSLTFESTEKEEGNLLVTNGNTYYKRTLSNLVRQDDVTDPVYVVSNTFDEYGNTGDWQLAFDTPSENDLQIYRNVKYNLWVTYDGIDYQYTKANRSSIVYGPNYDPENKALEFSGDYTNPIKSSMDELNLKILKINNYGSLPQITFIPIVDVQETGALNIILESSEETAEMVFGSTTNTEPVISGFTTVNYDGFTILSDGAKYDTDKKKLVDAEGQTMTLAVFTTSVELAKPIFETPSEDGMVSLVNDNLYTIGSGTDSQEIYYGTIKYSIVYADGSEGVTDEIYTSDFTISKPATVTAKVTLNGKESANAIGKYFGASKEEYTVAIGDKIEGTSWFTPVIESGDQIESKFMLQEIDESGIFEMGGEGPDHYLVAKKSGETTVIAYLFNSSNSSSSSTGTTVLNVSEEPILITFTVGESLSSVFEGNNNYGGLYNDSDTPYALPEGTTAYLITGISEDGTSVATQDIGYLPARTAVLLQRGEGAKAITKIPYEGSATVPTNNKFYYSDPNSPATAPTTRSWYVIYNNKFMKVTGGTKVNGGKCYLDLGTTAGTRGFYNIGGGEGTTSLREVKTDGVNNEKWTDGEWYTLQGQRVTKPAKGLYILNGKKVVVK